MGPARPLGKVFVSFPMEDEGDVVAGRRPGRMHDDDVVVFNPFGMAILDVAVAAAVVDVAVARGVGRALRR